MAEKGLPSNPEVERLVLGAILVDSKAYPAISAILKREDFSVEAHRRIFTAMTTLFDESKVIDRITVANELMRVGELESVGGLTTITSLDDGMPRVANPESYAQIVKQKSIARNTIHVAHHLQNELMVGETAPKEAIEKAVERLMGLMPEEQNAGPQTPGQIIESLGGVNVFLDPSKNEKGIPTGFAKFDSMTGGLYAGEMFILAARPSVGKSAMALNIASHLALKLEKRTVLFSLEMSKKALLDRLVCAVARVDSQRFRAGFLNQEERIKLQRAAATLAAAPIIIDDTSSTSAMDVISKTRNIQAKIGKVDMVCVDYLQLLHPTGKHENRNQEVTAISRMLKLAARDLDTTVLAISQLSRNPETRKGDGRPQLSDLRESGSLEQDADIVAFVFREELLKPDREDLRGVAELIIRKQRRGPIGTVNLVFLHHLTKFENFAEDQPDDWKDRAAGDNETVQ